MFNILAHQPNGLEIQIGQVPGSWEPLTQICDDLCL